jgi:hypothetical protein
MNEPRFQAIYRLKSGKMCVVMQMRHLHENGAIVASMMQS